MAAPASEADVSSSERGLGVLILVPGELGEKLSGPEIRAVRLGQALAVRHRVTLLAPGGGRDEYEGTGIGLALAKKVVEFHGGMIGLIPSPDGGTCVSFTLPIEKSPAHA